MQIAQRNVSEAAPPLFARNKTFNRNLRSLHMQQAAWLQHNNLTVSFGLLARALHHDSANRTTVSRFCSDRRPRTRLRCQSTFHAGQSQPCCFFALCCMMQAADTTAAFSPAAGAAPAPSLRRAASGRSGRTNSSISSSGGVGGGASNNEQGMMDRIRRGLGPSRQHESRQLLRGSRRRGPFSSAGERAGAAAATAIAR